MNKNTINLFLLIFLFGVTSCEAFMKKSHDVYIVVVEKGTDEPASIGSYSLRLYKDNMDYFVTGVVSKRSGVLEEMWIDDIDKNGRIDVIINTRSTGSGGYSIIDIYEMNNNKLIKKEFILPRNLDGYRGHDSFRINNKKLIRSYPFYRPSDSNANPTGGQRTWIYDFKKKAWLKVYQVVESEV